MKKFFIAAVLLLLVSSAAVAQDFPKFEVFGGYQFLKVNGLDEGVQAMSEDFPSNAVISTPSWLKRGFNASATWNINENFGIEASFLRNSDQILKATVASTNSDYQAKLTNSTFLVGPRFAFRKHSVVTPFAHVLLGVNNARVNPSLDVNGVEVDLGENGAEVSNKGFAFAAGGGIDLTLNKLLAVRMVQADYIRANHTIEGQDYGLDNLSLSFGVVFRFGGN